MTAPLPKTLPAFFWHFFRSYKWFVVGLLTVGLIWGIQNSVIPYFLKMIIDTIAGYHGDKAGIIAAVKWPAICYVMLWVLMCCIYRPRDWMIMNLLPNIRKDIISSMFSYLNRHSYSYMQDNFAGSLSNKISDMAGSTSNLFIQMEEFIATLGALVIGLVSMWLVSPLFSCILFGWTVLFITITFFFSKTTKTLSKELSESKSVLTGKIIDSVTNLTTIRLFARNHYENSRLDETIADTVTKDQAVQWIVLKMRVLWDISFILLMGLMLDALIKLYAMGKLTVGDFSFIMTVSLNMYMCFWSMARQFVQFATELGKCSQALTIITAAHDVVDRPDALPLTVTRGEITFDKVTFRYQRNNNLFQDKHVEIKAGSKVGLVGFSGSGKTTFVNLMLRFFDIESGHILIDGQDIAQITQDSLHEQIAMIPQDTSLFHRSLMENIRYGRIDATDEEVIHASAKAHCHEFISQLPEGYASLVGERGIKLSGGQRQRIAIARAILKNAPILILDEATSALDSVTEKLIQEGLHQLMEGHTTIVIAHRLSTLSEMDRILVFDKGQIIEDGTHEELLQKTGHYARMWAMQAGGFLPEREVS